MDDILSRVLARDNCKLIPGAEHRDVGEIWGKFYSVWKQAHWKNVETGDSRPFSGVVGGYNLSVLFEDEDTTFFATVQGRFGFSNRKIQPKDVVYVLYGGNAPFVLRPNPNDNTMQLIGDAYLDGVMFGEALTAENKMPDEWVTLV